MGDFLLEYRGKLLEDDPTGDDTYVYEFRDKGKTYWYVISLNNIYYLFIIKVALERISQQNQNIF